MLNGESEQVIRWLLEEDQPSARFYTLSDLLDRSMNDSEVKQTYSSISKRGWAHDILKLQRPGGYWESRKSLYTPKYTSTNWRALVLSDLGLTAKNPKVRKMAQLFFKDWLKLPSTENIFNDEVCLVGNTARMLTRLGYEDDHRVRKLFDRLVEDQKEDGGWHCFESNTGTLDGWEGLSAFAALPKSKRNRRIQSSIERGVEFYLQRRLYHEGTREYSPWLRFHYPNHYYYDLLVGLDIMTDLGYANDKRLRPALEILKRKRQRDGSWFLDKVHPDLGPGATYSLRKKAKRFAMEQEGKPSKWITLKALRILKRVKESS